MNIHSAAEIALHTGSIPSEHAPRGRRARSVPVTNGDLEPDEQQTLASWQDRMFFDHQQTVDAVFSMPQPKIEPPTRLELVRQELDRRLGALREAFMQSLVSFPGEKPKEKRVVAQEKLTPEREKIQAAFARLEESIPPEARLSAFLGFFMGSDGF